MIRTDRTINDNSIDLGDYIYNLSTQFNKGYCYEIYGDLSEMVIDGTKYYGYDLDSVLNASLIVLVSKDKVRNLKIVHSGEGLVEVKCRKYIFVNFNIFTTGGGAGTLRLNAILSKITLNNFSLHPTLCINKCVIKHTGSRSRLEDISYLDCYIEGNTTHRPLIGCYLKSTNEYSSWDHQLNAYNCIVDYDISKNFSNCIAINTLINKPRLSLYQPSLVFNSSFNADQNYNSELNFSNTIVYMEGELSSFTRTASSADAVSILPIDLHDAFTKGVPLYKGIFCGVFSDYPDEKDVLYPVMYGDGKYIGRMTLPKPYQVLKDVKYGSRFYTDYDKIGTFEYEKYNEHVGMIILKPTIED